MGALSVRIFQSPQHGISLVLLAGLLLAGPAVANSDGDYEFASGAFPPPGWGRIGGEIAVGEHFAVVPYPNAPGGGVGDVGAAIVLAPDENGQWRTESNIHGADFGLTLSSLMGLGAAIYEDEIYLGGINGDWAASGDRGAVYRFRREPSTGEVSFEGIIERPEPDTVHFGGSVDADSGWLAVGATLGESTDMTGAVYLYGWEEATGDWDYRQKLLAPQEDRDEKEVTDRFGAMVALSYPWLAVLASTAWVEGVERDIGAIYLYRHEPDEGWVLHDKVHDQTTPEGFELRETGGGFFFDGEHLLFSTVIRTADDGLFNERRLHVWKRTGQGNDASWEKTAQLDDPDPQEMRANNFGFSSAIRDDRLYVGYPSDSNASGDFTGAVWIYDRDETAPEGWVLHQRITEPWPNPSPITSNRTGSRLALIGETGFLTRASGVFLDGSQGITWIVEPDAPPADLSWSDAGTESGSPAFTQQLRVDNAGEAGATNVLVRLQLPEELTLTGADAPCWFDDDFDAGVCWIEYIAPGDFRILDLALETEADEGTDFTLDLRIAADQRELSPETRDGAFSLSVPAAESSSSSGCSIGRGPWEVLILLSAILIGRRRFAASGLNGAYRE
ncbi:integrin alpha [Gammaproteobacteria bacterium AB-CW1]|uniref:Integrin alpha n=1 Tax=Natronospira elongata TaxID=3110268 RepID=A0AAP6JDK8_9GAMM|nr:integrin alpha [Gammaproteobacteria bacterium AB-CW1]